MSSSIQWHVHCDVPGLRTLYHSTDGVSYSPVVVEGWLPFSSYLLALVTALTDDSGDSWSATVSGTGVVTFSTTGTARSLRFESASMADLLGFAYEDTAVGTSHTGAQQADGHIPIKGAVWRSPEPETDGALVRYRLGRYFSAPWGRGTVYEVSCWITGAALEVLMSGPCTAGKVRVLPEGATAQMTSAAPGGWLDGWVVEVNTTSLDRRDAYYEATLRIMLPAVDDRDTSGEALGDAVWGSLRRGYTLCHSLLAEGLPHRFVEAETALVESAAARTQQAVLIVDGAGGIGSTIDRRKGLLVSNSLTFGFLDPENTLGYWIRPSETYTLAAGVGYTDTEVFVNEDLSAVATSGTLNLGKEVLTYTGVDTGSSPHSFTGITRGVYAPLYGYRAESPKSFRTLTNVPTVWEGRMVELWAHLIDPWGRAVGTEFDDDYSIQVFLGAIESTPKWDKGTWGFSAHTLERRFAAKIGYDSQATLEGRASDDPGDIYVWAAEGAQFDLNEYTDSTSAAVTTVYHNSGGAAARLTLYQAAQSLLTSVVLICNGGGVDAIRELIVTGAEDLPNGDVRVTVRMTTGTDGVNFTVLPISNSTNWLTQWNWGLPSGSEGETTWLVHPRATERTGTTTCFIREPAEDLGTDSIPSSGYIVIEGDNGVELAKVVTKYAADTIGQVYRLGLFGRGLGGTPEADLTQADRKVRGAKYIHATPGEIALHLMESSGYGNRGAYDTLSAGWGYAIPSAYIQESSFSSLEWDLDDTQMIVAEPATLEDLLGGLFAIYGRHIGQLRVGRQLKLGVIESLPVQGAYSHTIRDADLMLRNAASAEGTKENPNVISVEGAAATLGGKEHSDKLTIRLTESVQARGAVEWKFPLRGLTSAEFYSVAPLLAHALANRAQVQSVVRLRTVPWKDWLAGQIVRLDLTHPNLWDWSTGQMGHEGWARVLGAPRDPETGVATLIVLCDGMVAQGVLCPSLAITDVSGTTLTLAEDPRQFFEVGDTVRLYNRGESAEYQDRVIATMTSSTIVVTVAPSGYIVGGTSYATYPDEGDGSGVQDAHVHVDDGSTWE